MFIEYDFHNHTNRSYCAKETATVQATIAGLEGMGFTSIGFCDHLYSETNVDDYLAHIRHEITKQPTKMDIFIGVEVDMFSPGVLAATQKQLSGFDYISVACPHYQNKSTVLPINGDYSVVAQNTLDYFISAAALPFVDIIVHPFDSRGLMKTYHNFNLVQVMKQLQKKDYLPIIDLLLKNNIAIELTERLRQQDYYDSLEPFLILCKESGICFSLGSDSHAPEHLGSIRKASDAIDRLGILPNKLWHPKQKLW